MALASEFEGDGDALPIRTDARVVGATIKAGETAEYRLGGERRAYFVLASGSVEMNGVRVNPRDGAAIADVDTLKVTAIEDSEIVLVDAVETVILPPTRDLGDGFAMQRALPSPHGLQIWLALPVEQEETAPALSTTPLTASPRRRGPTRG